ncbi:MAG: hypothetical protein WA816_01535 [Bacteroidales bacterium]
MKKKIFLFLLIISQFLISGYGQKGYRPGYIITNDSVTVQGHIKLESNFQNSKSCEFVESDNHNPKNYSPFDIKGYRIENSKYYVSRDVVIDSVKQRVFLEYLVHGIVDLFYYKDHDKEYYFVQKGAELIMLSNAGSLVTVKKNAKGMEYEETYFKNSNQYKRILQYLFQESPDVLKEIPNTSFDYRPLIKITKDYHKAVCKDNTCIDFTKSTNKSLYLEPGFGFINSWLGLSTSGNYAHNIDPYFGIQLRLKPFKGYTMWNFLTGLNYSYNDFLGDYDNTLYGGFHGIYRINTKYSMLCIPLTIEYSFPSEKLQPFISMSYNNVLILNAKYSVQRIDNYYAIDSYFRKYQFGVLLGLGLRYNLESKSYIFIKNEFGYRIPGANLGYVLDKTRVYSDLIYIGYGIKIK